MALGSSVSILARWPTDFPQSVHRPRPPFRYLGIGRMLPCPREHNSYVFLGLYVASHSGFAQRLSVVSSARPFTLFKNLVKIRFLAPLQPLPSSRSFADRFSSVTSCQQICLTPANISVLACTEMLNATLLALFSIILNATAAPVAPWVSWEDTHYNFSRV